MTAARRRKSRDSEVGFGCRAASKKKVSTTPATKRQMPRSKGLIWDHFLFGEKQNGSHIRAHCRGCIEKERPDGDILELDDEGKTQLSQSWVIEGKYHLLGARGLTNSSFCDGKHVKKALVAYSESKTPWSRIFWGKVAIVRAQMRPQRPGRLQNK
jgi:hypothetical protein